MTNLIAAIVVTLVTNVTVTDNHQGCQACETIRDGYRRGSVPMIWHDARGCSTQSYRAPTEKTETTTCKEVATVTFTHNGKEWSFSDARVLWSSNRVWRLKEQWVEEKPPEEKWITNYIWGSCATMSNILAIDPRIRIEQASNDLRKVVEDWTKKAGGQ